MRRAAAGLLFLLATTATAQDAADFEIRRIQAVGGNPVRGVPDGVIYEAPAGGSCTQTRAVAHPIASSLGDDIELQIEIAACPAGAGGSTARFPTVTCDWQLNSARNEDSFGSVTFDSQRGTISLLVPEVTSPYELTLSCRSGGALVSPNTVVGPVFNTLAPPRPTVSSARRPPPADWYLRAVTWGAGFSFGADDQAVTQALLDGLFAYGQQNWRYGYCARTGVGKRSCNPGPGCECRFDGHPPAFPTTELICDPGSPRCKCTPQDLVATRLRCNFADCYTFSDTLILITATMGLGGTYQVQEFGAFGLGFRTHAVAKSIDPAFSGNLLCGYRTLECNYLFSNHAMMTRAARTFDPTFGASYADQTEVVGQSVCVRDGPDRLLGGFLPAMACYSGDGYGLFAFYENNELPPRTEACSAPLLGSQSICRTLEDQPARLVGVGRPRPTDPLAGSSSESGPSRQFRQLAVPVEVYISQAGEYEVRGALVSGEALVSNRSAWAMKLPLPVAKVNGEPGPHTTILLFSGEEIRRAAALDEYQIELELRNAEGSIDTQLFSLVSRSIRPRRLGELDARILALERLPAGGFEVRLQAPVGGFYAYDAALIRDGAVAAAHGAELELEGGSRSRQRFRFAVDATPADSVALTLFSRDPFGYLDHVLLTPSEARVIAPGAFVARP